MSNEQPQEVPAAPAVPAAAAQQDDYVDKGFAAVNKKYGGNKINRSTQEKITDGARGLFEKLTGKKVSSKISN